MKFLNKLNQKNILLVLVAIIMLTGIVYFMRKRENFTQDKPKLDNITIHFESGDTIGNFVWSNTTSHSQTTQTGRKNA